jgi:hypothetical protein
LSKLGRAALRLARGGMRVIPIDPAAKRPHIKTGPKHGAASADQDVVTGWWAKWPKANIGHVPGTAGRLVVDVDGPEAERAARALGLMDVETFTVRSGREEIGLHLYFQAPEGAVREGAGALGPGLDVRCHTGYVIVPPSMHKSGRPYRVVRKGKAAPLPENVLALLQKEPSSETPAPAADLLAPSYDALREAVQATPNNIESRDKWIMYGSALKAAGAEWPDDALTLWEEFCGRWGEGDNTPEQVMDAWRSFETRKVGWAYIADCARVNVAAAAFEAFEAPKEKEPKEVRVGRDVPITLDTLYDDPDMLVEPVPVIAGIAYRGEMGLLSGEPGLGKSTWLRSRIAHELTDGQRVLWVTVEESMRHFARTCRQFGVPRARVDVIDPSEPIEVVSRALDTRAYDLLVVDSLHGWAAPLLGGEAGQGKSWGTALAALRAWKKLANLAIVCIGRARKSDGKYRDSSDIGHEFDVVVTLKKEERVGPNVRRFVVEKDRIGDLFDSRWELQGGRYVRLKDVGAFVGVRRLTPGLEGGLELLEGDAVEDVWNQQQNEGE